MKLIYEITIEMEIDRKTYPKDFTNEQIISHEKDIFDLNTLEDLGTMTHKEVTIA